MNVAAPALVVEYMQPAATFQTMTTKPAQLTVYGNPQSSVRRLSDHFQEEEESVLLTA